jgi:hypothetical protein
MISFALFLRFKKKIIGQYIVTLIINYKLSKFRENIFRTIQNEKFGKEKKNIARWFFYWEKNYNCSFWIPKEKIINI